MSVFRVALTFDAEHPDRPTEPGVQERVVGVLAAAGVRATFFVQGRWVEAYPATARSISGAGHLVGSHSHYHVRMPLLSEAGFDEDVQAAEAVIRDVMRVDPRPWFRLPFGAGWDDPELQERLRRRLQALGYRHVHWDVETEDWAPSTTERSIEDGIVDGALARGDGTVVLLHTWPRPVPAALDGAIKRLRDAGATFVALDALDGVA